MGNQYILTSFNLFTLQTEVFIGDNTKLELYSKTPLDRVAKAIATLAYNKNIYKVKLVGNKTFAESLIEDIKTEESTKFSENKIEIEVIE